MLSDTHNVACVQRDLFLTGGADGSIRLYHLLKQQVLLVLEPTSTHLYSVQWSPFRPLVFSATAGTRAYM